MARLNAQKGRDRAEARRPGGLPGRGALKALLQDQAYVVKELEQVETEWLALNADE